MSNRRAKSRQRRQRRGRNRRTTPDRLQYHRGRGRLESLEPRLVLAGDPFFAATSASTGVDLTLRVEDDMLRLFDNSDDSEVASAELSALEQGARIVGSPYDDALKVDIAASSIMTNIVGGIIFEGELGSDTLVGSDGVNSWSVTGTESGDVGGEDVLYFSSVENLIGGGGEDTFAFGLVGTLSGLIDGAGGDDTLVGPASNTTWSITSRDAGRVAGTTFQGIEKLTGAAHNEDVFVLEYGGSVSGLIEGGEGGFDTIAVADGGRRVIFTPTGPDSGTISVDGDVTRYTGFEPVDSGIAPDLVFDLSALAGSEFTLAEKAGMPDTYSLSEVNGGMEVHNFPDPGAGNSVSIILGSGGEKITLSDLTNLDASLSVAGNTGNDTYAFGSAFGDVTISEDPSEGDDTLDFSSFGGGPITLSPGSPNLTLADTASGANAVSIINSDVGNFESLAGANIDLSGNAGRLDGRVGCWPDQNGRLPAQFGCGRRSSSGAASDRQERRRHDCQGRGLRRGVGRITSRNQRVSRSGTAQRNHRRPDWSHQQSVLQCGSVTVSSWTGPAIAERHCQLGF